MKKPKALTKPQRAMLEKAKRQGFVLAPASVPTAWILERRGLLENVKMWTKTICRHGGYVTETYEYELRLTEKGAAFLASAEPRHAG